MIPNRPPSPHPTSEELYLARSKPEDAAHRRVIDHASLCAECSEELAHLESFENPDAVSASELERAWKNFGEPVAKRTPRRFTPSFGVFLAAAAALAVLAAGVLLTARRPVTDPGPLRSGGTAVTLVSPEGILKEPPREFVFTGAQGPARVMVFDAARDYSWTSEPDQTGRVMFPESERLRLKPETAYSWTVLSERDAPVKTFRLAGGARSPSS